MRSSTLRVALVGALSLVLTGCGAGSAFVGVHDAPSQVTTVAPISAQSAEEIATRVLAKAADASAAKPAEAAALRADALTGSALAVANAASRLQTGAGRHRAAVEAHRTPEGPRRLPGHHLAAADPRADGHR